MNDTNKLKALVNLYNDFMSLSQEERAEALAELKKVKSPLYQPLKEIAERQGKEKP